MNNPVIPLLLLEKPDILTGDFILDFDEIKKLTDLEIQRLGWTKEQTIEHLNANYKRRTRLHLTSAQIFDYLAQLRRIF